MARYAERARFVDIPKECVKQTKRLVLDSIGCALGGCGTKEASILLEYSKEVGGKCESTIVGNAEKVSCLHAAFVNAQIGNILDFDEVYRNMAHPFTPIVYAALSIAEREEVSGEDFITAVVTGFEVATRIGAAIYPTFDRAQRVYGFSWEAFGATTAASKILGIDLQAIKHAYGIVGGCAPITGGVKMLEIPASMQRFCNAWISRIGVEAALLAEKGFTGFPNILDGDTGFWIMAGSDRCDWDQMVQGLGEEYNIMKTSLKPYTACRWIHPILDAIRNIIQEEKVIAKDINTVICKSFKLAVQKPFDNQTPRTLLDAQWSVPWAVAMILLGMKPGPEWYRDENLKDQKILETMKKVKVELDPRAEEIYPEKTVAIVELFTKRQHFAERVDYPKGDPENPMTAEETRGKFRYLASYVLKQRRIERTIEIINNLERIGNMTELTEFLHP